MPSPRRHSMRFEVEHAHRRGADNSARPGIRGTNAGRDRGTCGRQRWTSSQDSDGPDRTARRRRSERLRGRAVRGSGNSTSSRRPTRSSPSTASTSCAAITAAPTATARAARAPPVLLVPPMMLAAEIYDVSPATSAVTLLHERGVDPWVVDFGAPEREEGGLERTLADHVLAVSDAVDRVREATGREVHLGGYSQGGMFCYQVAAYRRNDGLGSLITFGSPVDTRLGMPFGLPEELASGLAGLIAERLSQLGAAGVVQPQRLPAARPGQVDPQQDRVRVATARSRGAVAARATTAVPGGRRVGGVAGPGAGRIRRPVHRPQPDAGGRLRHRRAAAQPGRHPLPDPVGGRDRRRDRPAPRGARDPPGRAARRRLRAGAARGPLRPGGRLDLQPDDLADGGGVGTVARRGG